MSTETLPWNSSGSFAPDLEFRDDGSWKPEPYKRKASPRYPVDIPGARDSDWATDWMSEAVQEAGGSLVYQRLARYPNRLQGSLDSGWAAEWMGGEGRCCGSCADGRERVGGGDSKACASGSNGGCCHRGSNDPYCESCATGGQRFGNFALPVSSDASVEPELSSTRVSSSGVRDASVEPGLEIGTWELPIFFALAGYLVKGCKDACEANDECGSCKVCDVAAGSVLGGGPKPPPVHRKLNKALVNLGNAADWISAISAADSLTKLSASLAQSKALSGALANVGAAILKINNLQFGVPIYARLCGQECKTRDCGMLWWADTETYCADVDYGWKIVLPKTPYLPGYPWNQTWSSETKWESKSVKKLMAGKLAKLVAACEEKRNPKKKK